MEVGSKVGRISSKMSEKNVFDKAMLKIGSNKNQWHKALTTLDPEVKFGFKSSPPIHTTRVKSVTR